MSTFPRVRVLATVLAVGSLLAACGGSTPAASDAPSFTASATATQSAPASTEASAEVSPGTELSACQLVTPDDIATVLGDMSDETVEVAEGELTENPTVLDPFGTQCRYSGDWGGLVVSLTPADGENLYDAARGSYADASDVETPGADSAFWSESQHRGFFWKGAVNVMLQFTHLTVDVDWGEATSGIGAAAIGKL
jgi:hypothetical protein